MAFNATVFLSVKVWLPWVLFGVLLIGVLIAVIVYLKNRPKGLAEVEARLRQSEAESKALQAKLIVARVEREKAESERASFELALLESTHKARIKMLTAKEKSEYDKVKNDPESGVAHMRKLLGLDS